MNYTIITLAAMLAGIACMFGRNCIINNRLKNKIRHLKENNKYLESRRDLLTKTQRTLGALVDVYTERTRTYGVKRLAEGTYAVTMSVETAEGEDITVPVKFVIDEEDPDFALREAEEYKEKLEE